MSNNYRQHVKLQGHFGPLYCLTATDDGNFLASGGKDGTRVWDLRTRNPILDRPANEGIRGATTAITWANLDDEPGEMLFFGTVAGFLVCWRQPSTEQGFVETFCRRLANGSEIMALAFDAVSNRLAVSNYGSAVQVYALAASSEPRVIFAITIVDFIPKALVFGAMRGNERELLAFGHLDGKIRTFTSIQNNPHSSYWEVGCRIGDATVDTRRATVCIDNIHSGAVIYRLDDHQFVKRFLVPATTQEKLSRQVRFVDDSKAIVIGSDHGVVYVFDRRSGEVLDELILAGKGWVQTIAVEILISDIRSFGLRLDQTANCENIPTIFAANSGDGLADNPIYIWRKTADRGRTDPSAWEVIMSVSMVALLVYAYQNWDVLEVIVKQKLADFIQ
ncbi:WD40-repeat-containing domain protein [Mycena galopus ATCC 62051]|nr:WD40-repeat-containing domain protein [Mycena galopus ATCC 62051]